MSRQGAAIHVPPAAGRSVAVFGKGRPATVLTGKPAENLLAAAPECSGEELQLLLAKATGSFERKNETRARRR